MKSAGPAIPDVIKNMATAASDDPIGGPEIFGRLNFLEQIQIHSPQFWGELREVEKEHSQEAVAAWMMRSGVIDAWFIQIIWDTIQYWRQHPDCPASRLETATPWFNYRVVNEEQFQLPYFNLRFIGPDTRPTPFGEDGQMEAAGEFASRMRKNFEVQLSAYLKYYQSLQGTKSSVGVRDAAWTALMFTGKSARDIHAEWLGKRPRRSEHPYKAVIVAVKRFAEGIGLELP